MLGCFPDPYPDELLYSVCARFHDRIQYSNKKSTMREMFGDEAAIATIGLFSNLGSLVSVLPPGSPYTVERLINRHTFFPFYAPFLDPKQAQQIWIDMEGARGSVPYLRSGIMASTIQSLKWLRFCPLCAQSDREQLGEYYWHRLHQLPGIEICPEHNVRILNSQIRIQNPRTRHEFVSAERGIQLPKSRSYKILNSYQGILLKIAQDTAWLLNQQPLAPGLDILVKRYHQLLVEQDLATHSGRVRVSQLLGRFCNYYSSELLEQLQCQIDIDSQQNWLFRLVRSPKGSQHPLRHLLLMQFLGHTAEAFSNLPKQFAPFGKGPWFCLNKAAKHFRQTVIYGCEITYSQDHGKPIGTFKCLCGFIYARTGPDNSEEDALRITKIKAFGSIWEDALKQLWQNPSISLRGIARELGVDAATVKLRAAALGLSFPRQGKRQINRMQRSLASSPKSGRQEASETTLECYRTDWLEAMRKYPDVGRTFLRKQFQRIYSWLYHNDSEWLKAHLPSRMPRTPLPTRVNWQNRDAELADRVKIAALRVQNEPGKPVQITVAAIARELGQLSLIQKHSDKLPLTTQALAELVETREVFALRRIQWVVKCWLQKGICPQRGQVIRQAGLRPEVLASPSIQEAIEQALEKLHGNIFHENNLPLVQRNMAN